MSVVMILMVSCIANFCITDFASKLNELILGVVRHERRHDDGGDAQRHRELCIKLRHREVSLMKVTAMSGKMECNSQRSRSTAS